MLGACDDEGDSGQQKEDMAADSGADTTGETDLVEADTAEETDTSLPETDSSSTDDLTEPKDDVQEVQDIVHTDMADPDMADPDMATADIQTPDTSMPDVDDEADVDPMPDVDDEPDVLVEADVSEEDMGALAPTLTEVTTAIFVKSCATAGCHTTAAKKGSLDFQAADIWGQLVDVQAKASKSKKRVVAGDSDLSFLIQKMENKQAANEGARMPPAPFPKLAQDKIDMVRAWIDAGALNN